LVFCYFHDWIHQQVTVNQNPSTFIAPRKGSFAATGQIHTEKSFPNLIKSNMNRIVFTVHRLIWNQMDVRFVPNQSENGKYNLISVLFNKFSLCVVSFGNHAYPIKYTLLITLKPSQHYRVEGFKAGPQLFPHYTETLHAVVRYALQGL